MYSIWNTGQDVFNTFYESKLKKWTQKYILVPYSLLIVHVIVRSKVTGQTSMNPLISANYFFAWILFTFKLPESFWNCFKAILQTQEMNF